MTKNVFIQAYPTTDIKIECYGGTIEITVICHLKDADVTLTSKTTPKVWDWKHDMVEIALEDLLDRVDTICTRIIQ